MCEGNGGASNSRQNVIPTVVMLKTNRCQKSDICVVFLVFT